MPRRKRLQLEGLVKSPGKSKWGSGAAWHPNRCERLCELEPCRNTTRLGGIEDMRKNWQRSSWGSWGRGGIFGQQPFLLRYSTDWAQRRWDWRRRWTGEVYGGCPLSLSKERKEISCQGRERADRFCDWLSEKELLHKIYIMGFSRRCP